MDAVVRRAHPTGDQSRCYECSDKDMSLTRQFNFGLAILIMVGGGLALFVAAPLDGMNFHPFVSALQAQLRTALESFAPFLMVGALGAGVGLAEVSSSFTDYPREAIATRWGQLMIWLNALAAVLALLIARVYAPQGTNQVLLIIGVGVGFQAIIRTKFTLAKQFGGQGGSDLSLNLGWLYEQFQALCKKQIDLELMKGRLEQVESLLGKYSTPQLYVIARYTVRARATLTEEEEAALQEELKKLIADTEGGPQSVRMNLALKILELGGQQYVDRLVTRPYIPGAEMTATPLLDAATPDTSTESVAKRLTQLPLNDLVSLAKDLLKAPEDQSYIEQTAASKPGLSEVKQKAPIAYYVVSRASPQTAQEALDKRNAAQT